MVEHALVEEHLRQHDLGEVRLLDGVAETSLMCDGDAKGEGVTAIVCGPVPCDAPDPVATLMPLVRSNSGNNSSYAQLNPPNIRTFTRATSYS